MAVNPRDALGGSEAMHILFIHPNLPAQFGHIAHYLATRHGFRISFLTRRKARSDAIEILNYQPRGGANRNTNFCSRTFENYVWNSGAVFSALRNNPQLRPDVVIAHSGFGTSAFVKYAIDAKVISYCELFYDDSPDFQPFRPGDQEPLRLRLRSRGRNAMMLLDLHSADRGYCPTKFQRSTFPREYQSKLATVPDPIDTAIWRPRDQTRLPRKIGSVEIPPNAKIVTYVSRGFERLRGFDIFVEVAARLCKLRSDLLFVCVGSDRVAYGPPDQFSGYPSYKEMVLSKAGVDRSRFIFPGYLPPPDVASILAFSDLHIYLTEPFVLSWSLLNALACGCIVLASDTPPVREVICSGRNGLLRDFFDIDGFVTAALDVLDNPAQFAGLRIEAARRIQERHAMEVAVPRLLRFIEDTIGRRPAPVVPAVAYENTVFASNVVPENAVPVPAQ
jgi:glycosyltransferase involved in cell wall biosynthesis